VAKLLVEALVVNVRSFQLLLLGLRGITLGRASSRFGMCHFVHRPLEFLGLIHPFRSSSQ
jgi:hypothetical protein